MTETLQGIKSRFGIIGNSVGLERALQKAMQVGPTDISVLVTGESGVGKEFIPKIIHALSVRKHNNYIAVNCGAIPEGTIDSELFGHEKGAFTGANATRKGYFEVADGGTIFLDEVGELPLHTQVRLLRVLESGEFMKVGSSDIQKTDARIVAATNVNVLKAVRSGKFREDLYYRLNTVEITLPPLRERGDDIYLLFRKFANDFAAKYQMPVIRLDDRASQILSNYSWPGNIRQLRNFAEELSVVEAQREISAEVLKSYLPKTMNLPAVIQPTSNTDKSNFENERELIYQLLFDMKKDLNDLRGLTLELLSKNGDSIVQDNKDLVNRVYESYRNTPSDSLKIDQNDSSADSYTDIVDQTYEEIKDSEESLSLQDNEMDLIKKALDKYDGKRKEAANELGISERTLYRKIKQYDLV